MKILITNAYSSRNKGDAAILLGMLADLGSQTGFRGAEFLISTAAYPEDLGAYPCGVVSSFHALKQRFTRFRWLQGLGFFLFIFPWSMLWALARRAGCDLWAPASWRALFREYAEADLVVAAGGGYLYTRSAWRGNLMLLITVHSFYFATLLDKPLYLYAQSIGPFATEFQAALVRCALKGARMVIAREQISMDMILSWKLLCPVHVGGDAAFLLPKPGECDLPVPLERSAPRVGLTVRKWSEVPAEQECFEFTMAGFITWLTGERLATVVLIPQVTFAAWGDDDREVMRRVYARIVEKNRVMLVEDDLSPMQVKALCGAVDFFVGTRMHSNIFALSMGVPSMAIGYQPKSAGIMHQLGLERWVIEIKDVTLPRLQALFEDLTDHAVEVRENLARQVPVAIEKARLNGRWIEEDFLHRAA
jgi:colanic acid/amylovoran biosynthesis protein